MKIMLENWRIAPNFRGIHPAYKNGNGFTVIPIEQDPKQKEINSAIEATKKGGGYEGMNGRAYMLGEDLVVKKYKKEGEALNYNPMREIGILDKLWEDGKTQQGNQCGLYAVKSPDGTYYLVSTRVKGETIEENPDVLNKGNLASITQKIEKLDSCVLKEGEDGKKILFRPMHYDLSNGNIKFDSTEAGIFDFEYMGYENIDFFLNVAKSGEFKGLNPHTSDIMGTPSNLRTFEHRTVYNAIRAASKPKETFDNYLSTKSKYYADMQKDLPTSEDKEIYRDYKKRCLAHSKMLSLAVSDPDYKDVKTAEAIKIQMSRWIFEASNSSAFGDINPKQIEEYTDNAKAFFNRHLEKAKEGSFERLYYKDCADLMNAWGEVSSKINSTLKEPDSSLPEREYKEAVQRHERLLGKIRDEKTVTLDKLIAD